MRRTRWFQVLISQTGSFALTCVLLSLVGCDLAPEQPSVIAIVNGKPITQIEFDQRWSELAEARKLRYEREGGKRAFLEHLIDDELMIQEARRRGLDKSPQVVTLLERHKEVLVIDELKDRVVNAEVEITDRELANYYLKHSSALLIAEKYEAAQIVVPDADLAMDLKKKLDNGADFGTLARKHSVDKATRSKGGKLGVYKKGKASPKVEAAILTLEPGSVSDPVHTDRGFYLIKVLSRKPIDRRFAGVARDRLRQELYAEKRRKRYEDLLSDLRDKARLRTAEPPRAGSHDGFQEVGALPRAAR
ncbi:MAG: peptidylprolyl isomerase [Nitrospiraceae bacterium]